MRIEENYSLLKHNTFEIDAKCRRFVEYETVEEAQQVAEMLTAEEPLLIVGEGSNLLLTADFQGTVVHSAIKGIETAKTAGGDVLLKAGSGETWDDVVACCVENGWQGAENLSLIPGEVGASAVQNIGAYGAEVKDLITVVEAVEIATGRVCVFDKEACAYGYRDSKFKHEWKNRYLMTYVTYRLKTTNAPLNVAYGNIRAELDKQGIAEPTLKQLREVIIAIRQEKLPDPKVEGNAGSFFMNSVVSRDVFESLLKQYPTMPHYHIDEAHEKVPAGWLIDQCGWKGRTVGRAGVHAKQALVLVNRGGATGEEVVNLCKTICQDVEVKFGISIKPEVNII